MIVVLLILLGLALGSFVNAFVWRLHERKDWVGGRSECPHCHHALAPKDLVPVLSWIILKGKCRYCGKPIPDSPVVELAVPALFVLSYLFWPIPFDSQGLFVFCLWLLFLVAFVALAVYDIRWFLLPNKIVFVLIGLAIAQVLARVFVFGESWTVLSGAILGVITISGLFLAVFLLSKGTWIGFGDVKLAVVLGLLAGGLLPALLVLLVSSVLGMMFSLPLLLAGKANRKSRIPFGPFLLAAMVFVQLFGSGIISWYANLLLL